MKIGIIGASGKAGSCIMEEALARSHDVTAICAPFGSEQQHVDAGNVLIEALKGAPDIRLIVVGGAGSLYVDPDRTTRVMDKGGFPKQVIATANSQAKNLNERFTIVAESE